MFVFSRVNIVRTGLLVLIALSANESAFAAGEPKTPEEFASQYMTAFNKKDTAALKALRYPLASKSSLQDLIDSMTDAELAQGTHYDKFEIAPPTFEMEKPMMGPDGIFYESNLKLTNLVKLTSVTKDGSTSTTVPIGQKDGIYYLVCPVPAEGATPQFQFGWQRFTPPAANWSVLMPNEPEPGRAALEKQYGKDALKDVDLYGVMKNTANTKTTQHFYICGSQGKRFHDNDNKEEYRAACTTFTPETLKGWFSDPKKNLDDAVNCCVQSKSGSLIAQKPIDFSGAPGREFEIRTKEGALRLGREYWIKDALYELTYDSKAEKPDRSAANKFLNSLEVR